MSIAEVTGGKNLQIKQKQMELFSTVIHNHKQPVLYWWLYDDSVYTILNVHTE